MSKKEKIRKPERVELGPSRDPIEIAIPSWEIKNFKPYTDREIPVFTIKQVIGEKRKRVAIGSAMDHPLD